MKNKNGNGQNGQSTGNGSTTATAVIKPHPAATTAGKVPDPGAAKPEEPKEPGAAPVATAPAPAQEENPNPRNLPAKLDLPPLEDRVHKVEELYEIVGRLEALQDSKRKLNAFKLSTDGNADRITLRDSRGNEFVTSNSAVITEVHELMKTVIDRKIVETANMIRF